MNTRYSKTIYTFLAKNSPSYLSLCIKSWFCSVPDGYKIVVLNESTFCDYVPEDIYNKLVHVEDLRFFFDYLAAAVIFYNGGLFLDADTIMLPKFFPQDILLSCTDVVLFSDGINNICPGYLLANKGAEFLSELLDKYSKNEFVDFRQKKRSNIINDVVKKYLEKEVLCLDAENNGYLIEKAVYGVSNEYLYKKHYFSSVTSVEEFFQYSKGLTALHNSLTPEEYKYMNTDEFLNQDILLSKIFKLILTDHVH